MSFQLLNAHLASDRFLSHCRLDRSIAVVAAPVLPNVLSSQTLTRISDDVTATNVKYFWNNAVSSDELIE